MEELRMSFIHVPLTDHSYCPRVAFMVRVGSYNGEEVYVPFKSLVPMVNPNGILFGGWDISSMNMADAMCRAKVLDIDLQKQLRGHMESMVPLPGIFNPYFITANQGSRANNIIKGTKKEHVDHIIQDIREFKKNKVDKVVVLLTVNTEWYSDIVVGLNDTVDNLLASLDKNAAEISPSNIYAIACFTEAVPFVNRSPQTTFVPTYHPYFIGSHVADSFGDMELRIGIL